eukprot:TRINITY_DN674_c0_g1_i1.p1 TRINITY_DN674_c0_g1~~TRINITY_DN674_c0_g1_i1.p1  ORF type:complete len:199 (+),score=61.11 TRINITY_DN674_c0_g1_i1:29-598(+)
MSEAVPQEDVLEQRSKALAEFQAELEQRKLRAEKGGSTYTLTDEDKQKLRQLKFGPLIPQPRRERKRKSVGGGGGGDTDAAADKSSSNGHDGDNKDKKPKKARGGRVQVNLDDPDVKRRLERFGPAPEKSILARALKDVQSDAASAAGGDNGVNKSAPMTATTTTNVSLSAEELAKIEARKAKFSAVSS